MKTETLSPEIFALENNKDEVCVSIIVPTQRSGKILKDDHLKLKRAVDQAIDLVKKDYPKETVKVLERSLQEIYESVEHQGETGNGIGIFVSPKGQLLKRFDLPVKEKIVVADNFEVRDLLLEEQYARPYVILVLTEIRIRLFTGNMERLTETRDGHFPISFIDDYEYSPPTPASSFSGDSLEKGFEKDKSILAEIRVEHFFHKADELLTHYLPMGMPLIVSAENKELGYFQKITKHTANICGEIRGSYAEVNEKQLGDLAWPVMRSWLEEEQGRAISEYREMPTERIEAGLVNVWRAIAEGRGLKLIVEMDFSCTAYMSEDEYTLYTEPQPDTSRKLTDAVDDLMEKAMSMNTAVLLVQNEKLKEDSRVVLVTRY
jgi:hypothetical protein